MKKSFQHYFNRDWKNIKLSCCCSGRRDPATVLLLLIVAHIGHNTIVEGYNTKAKACNARLVENTMLVRTKLARCKAITVKDDGF
ncbi:hypothetical protein NC653_004164 [Populus alba x Populus x berolinensis]|uniref:Uncharacterized protein n=1 Tax=Populus alba x Populus x berolinensis TaxID=444605 RepID=A0AAD6RTI7_9ROSI|nr:hypothetical protein NC653_004164 [Populus alba x Populus x berolinensis]